MTEPATFARRLLAVGIGLFALGQLVFLPASNLMMLVPRSQGANDRDPVLHGFQEYGSFTSIEPIQRTADAVGGALDAWAEISGLEQGWKMFVPGIPPYSLFTAVDLHYPDGEVVQIRSQFEPDDLVDPPVRAPLLRNRMYNFEAQFTISGWYSCPESLAACPEMWSEELPKSVRDQHRHIIAWLKWNVGRYRAAHPDRDMPAEVVLIYRFIPSPLPGEPRGCSQPIAERPYARWFPGGPSEAGYLPLEGFDPVANRYVRFPVGSAR